MQNTIGSLLIFFLTFFTTLPAQNGDHPLTNRVNLLFGLNQPLLGGFNIEGNLFYKRLAFDYSHGISLNLSNNTLSGDAASQGLAVHIPYTTGFGIGYRFNDWLNVRVEPKWHRFEIYYEGAEQIAANQIVAYNTFTLGLGAYGNLRPFKHQENLLKGIMVSPSVRWWPNVSTSLDEDVYTYENVQTGQSEAHEALNIGFGNTPLILNISVGYSIEF